MDDDTIFSIIVIVGFVIFVGSYVICLMDETGIIDIEWRNNTESVNLSDDNSKSHAIIPISTGGTTTFAVI